MTAFCVVPPDEPEFFNPEQPAAKKAHKSGIVLTQIPSIDVSGFAIVARLSDVSKYRLKNKVPSCVESANGNAGESCADSAPVHRKLFRCRTEVWESGSRREVPSLFCESQPGPPGAPGF